MLVLAASLTAADAAQADPLSVGVGSSSLGTNITVQVSGDASAVNGKPGLKVSGTADGVITVEASTAIYAVAPICTQNTPTSITCGSAAKPVERFEFGGFFGNGDSDDVVDLTGLAEQNSSTKAFAAYGRETGDTTARMRGVFAKVATGAGNDTVLGGGAGTTYIPGPGNDTITGGAADDLVLADADTDGNDTFDLAGGFDVVSYRKRTEAVTATIGASQTTANGALGESDRISGTEGLAGGRGADRLTITGAVGNQGLLIGYHGDDILTGGPGPDLILGGYGSDVIEGGGGDDRLEGAGDPILYVPSSELPAVGRDALSGGPGDDEIIISRNWIRLPPPIPSEVADQQPDCGDGNDVLRADPGLDDGVGPSEGPASCEFLATVVTSRSVIAAGAAADTLTFIPGTTYFGASPVGRIERSIWTICRKPSNYCGETPTVGASYAVTAADVGGRVQSVRAELAEPLLSRDPRWIQERTSKLYEPATVVAWNGGTIADLMAGSGNTYPGYPYPTTPQPTSPNGPVCSCSFPPPTTPEPTTPQPTVPATPASTPRSTRPLSDRLVGALQRAFGAKPRLSLLRRNKVLRFAAPAGATVRVTLTVPGAKRRSKPILVARGSATAGGRSTVALRLRLTKAAKKAAKSKRAVRVTLTVATIVGGKSTTATTTLKLRP